MDPIGQILSYLVAISTIIGIPTGLYGYLASLHAKKVEHTYELYKEFRSENFQKDWVLLIRRWNEKASDVQKILDSNDEQQLQKFVTSLATQDEAASTAFTRAVGFFDEVDSCIENSLCDANVGVNLLKIPASQFVGVFGPHIIFLRSEYRNQKYATGVFKLRSLNTKFSFF